MSRKDYIVAAKMVSELSPQEAQMIVPFLKEFFKVDNYRFNEDRFSNACLGKESLRGKSRKV
jgi:hypothetical protein